MSAVLIGNAAHIIPEILSSDDINWAMSDALELCRMIVDRYDYDKLFSRIANDFYAKRLDIWHGLRTSWEEKWMRAHALPYDPSKAYLA